MAGLPKALTSKFGADGLPLLHQTELKKHFELVPYDEYEQSRTKYDKEIVAIFTWYEKVEGNLVFTPPVTAEIIDRMPMLKIVSAMTPFFRVLRLHSH